MTWVKLDAEFYRHPKVRRLSDGAYRAFVDAICYSNDELLDGDIDRGVARSFGWLKRSAELEGAGLWEPIEDGWHIHDYEHYQPSKAKVLEEREKAARRMGRVRGNVRPNIERSSRASVSDSDPDATHPEKNKPARAKPAVVDEEFITELVKDFAGSFDEERIRFELDKAENNKRVWDGWRDKRRGFRNWLKQAKEWQDKDAGTTRGGARTAGGQPNRGSPRAAGVAPNGRGSGAADGFDVAPAGSIRADAGPPESDPGAQPEGGYARRALAGGGAW